MIFKSLHAKLLAIYVGIVVGFLACLGGTLTISYRKNLTVMRENSVVECAEQIANMYADGSLAIVDLENGQTIPVLMTMAKDFDATIQIVNTTSKRLFFNMSADKMTVYETDLLVEEDIFNTVYNNEDIYIRSNYYNSEMDENVSTIAYPIMYPNSAKDAKPWAILIINSSLAPVNEAFSHIVATLWVPAILVSLLGLVIVYTLTNKIVRRVKILNNATEKIAKGGFDTRVNFKEYDEIRQLAEGFNKMAEDLKIAGASKWDFV